MGIHLTLQISYKFRLLLLFALCMMVIGWATSSYLVAAIQEIPKAKIFNRTVIWRKELASSNTTSMTQSKLKKCPLLSPYLRHIGSLETRLDACECYLGGTNKLIFKSNLTWGEVQTENTKVQKGRYHPEDCKALQRVAILIPHRNREKHLLYLLKHLHPFLQRQQVEYGIYVIHQAGDDKFNRAKLLNVGYLEALKEEKWDCFIFHDVDLIPENDLNLYMCEAHPKHLVVGRNSTGYRLRYKGYFGGVTALTRDQFYMVNGFSNNYWGWGAEDDDLRIRVEIQGMKISRPPPSIAKYTMIFHARDKGNEENSERMKLLKQVSRVWRTDGLNSCSYNLLSVKHNPLYINITVNFLVTP